MHESLPMYAGGLGVLAGDHLKSSSDLGLPMVGVGFLYLQGYFRQRITEDGWQEADYDALDFAQMPITRVMAEDNTPLVFPIDIPSRTISVQVWKVQVGRIPLFLLNTDVPANSASDRQLTYRLYSPDPDIRISQEIVMGIGGVRVLRAMKINPKIFHMNEGHPAFGTLERAREFIKDEGLTFEEAQKRVRATTVFTTHTPVPAGNDRFAVWQIERQLNGFWNELGLTREQFMALADHEGSFGMTVLALRMAEKCNAVSELHGQVARKMWAWMYPGKEVPISHITNGIHLLGWMKGTVRQFWRKKLNTGDDNTALIYREKFGTDWATAINQNAFWEKMTDPAFVADEELWALRYKLRRELIEFARRRLLQQNQRATQGDYIRFDHLLNPDALTIGFARRFATYKRAPLIFQQFENIVKLTHDRNRPVQFIFAGKAHPRDDEGKRFIQQIIHLSKHSELAGKLVFLENYDIHVARQMVSGCDIWLNNPRRPLEASGTSGMKASCHGCMNMSILDGWWREGYDGTNGFAIGLDSHPDNIEEQDRVDSANLYQTLTEQVVPLFFDRDAQGIPRKWIQRIRRTMMTLVPQFTTDRMVKEYTKQYYQVK